MEIWLCSSDWMGQVSAHWSKKGTRNSLIRVDSEGRRSTVLLFCRLTVQSTPFPRNTACERPLWATAARLELWSCAQLTTRSPPWQIYSFSKSTILNLNSQSKAFGMCPKNTEVHILIPNHTQAKGLIGSLIYSFKKNPKTVDVRRMVAWEIPLVSLLEVSTISTATIQQKIPHSMHKHTWEIALWNSWR